MPERLSEKDIQRFWSKVDIKGANDCWPWKAKSRGVNGYGLLKHFSGANIIASRISCFLAHGAPPYSGARTLHSCDNPPCCNPQHLRWGTAKDNVEDAMKRKRHINPPRCHDVPAWEAKRKKAMPRGQAVWNQSLDETTVRKIWNLHFQKKNVSEIAILTGCKKHVVSDVCRGKSWQHLEGAPSPQQLKEGGVRRGYNQFS